VDRAESTGDGLEDEGRFLEEELEEMKMLCASVEWSDWRGVRSDPNL